MLCTHHRVLTQTTIALLPLDHHIQESTCELRHHCVGGGCVLMKQYIGMHIFTKEKVLFCALITKTLRDQHWNILILLCILRRMIEPLFISVKKLILATVFRGDSYFKWRHSALQFFSNIFGIWLSFDGNLISDSFHYWDGSKWRQVFFKCSRGREMAAAHWFTVQMSVVSSGQRRNQSREAEMQSRSLRGVSAAQLLNHHRSTVCIRRKLGQEQEPSTEPRHSDMRRVCLNHWARWPSAGGSIFNENGV